MSPSPSPTQEVPGELLLSNYNYGSNVEISILISNDALIIGAVIVIIIISIDGVNLRDVTDVISFQMRLKAFLMHVIIEKIYTFNKGITYYKLDWYISYL